MISDIGSQPLVVHAVGRGAIDEACPMAGFELRSVNLGEAAGLLRMAIAELDRAHAAADSFDLGSYRACGAYQHWTA